MASLSAGSLSEGKKEEKLVRKEEEKLARFLEAESPVD
jgi:hypothetical protein